MVRCIFSPWNSLIDFFSFVDRWSRRHGLGVVHPLHFCDVRCPIHGRVSVVDAVSLRVYAYTLLLPLMPLSTRTSAGLYYFSAKMAPPKYAPLASWITGLPLFMLAI